MNASAEILSLALTVSGIIWAIEVIRYWWPEARAAWVKPSKERTPSDWLILGIVWSFAGSILDNLYWAAAWFSRLMELGVADGLFFNGVYANIPFRQMPLIIASMLHTLGAVAQKSNPVVRARAFRRFKLMVWHSAGAFVVTLILLVILRALIG